jgi:O-acetyl-ADP-ribose deacetylase (regulator of RNase III)
MNKINYITGDLLESEIPLIVHGVNMMGVMGAGVAKAIALKYPEAKKAYLAKIDWKPGDIQIVKINDFRYICNLCSQRYYGRSGIYANLDWIDVGFRKLFDWMEESHYKKLATCKIGTGFGGLHWDDVEYVIKGALKNKNINIFVYSLK